MAYHSTKLMEILELRDFYLLPTPAGWMAHFECVIDDMAVLHHATVVDPAEYTAALCAGSVLLADDDAAFVEVGNVEGQLALAQDVHNWTMV